MTFTSVLRCICDLPLEHLQNDPWEHTFSHLQGEGARQDCIHFPIFALKLFFCVIRNCICSQNNLTGQIITQLLVSESQKTTSPFILSHDQFIMHLSAANG